MKVLIQTALTIFIFSFTTSLFAFDVDGDGVEGLAEAIHALQVSAGIAVPLSPRINAVPADVLTGKTFYNSNYNALVGTRYPAAPAKTGQTDCWESPGTLVACTDTGQDGDLRRGVRWPSPRFINNGDGTVTDELTGLIWMQNANCGKNAVTRDVALTYANAFYDGYGFPMAMLDCGLSDLSRPGDWRLPNRFELESLLDLGQTGPALPAGHPFINVESGYYWSSSYNSYYADLGIGWAVHFSAGAVQSRSWALEPCYVWLVKGQ